MRLTPAGPPPSPAASLAVRSPSARLPLRRGKRPLLAAAPDEGPDALALLCRLAAGLGAMEGLALLATRGEGPAGELLVLVVRVFGG